MRRIQPTREIQLVCLLSAVLCLVIALACPHQPTPIRGGESPRQLHLRSVQFLSTNLFRSNSYPTPPVVLTVGSPTLAAYSLALTAVNARWAIDRFSDIQYFDNHENAAKALIYLQQVPLRLSARDGMLASLIVLPENDDWWEVLVDRLERTYTWTIATATSIAWVIVALILTIIDSFQNLGDDINSTGQGVGTLWLWLIPIVVGWLWTPACSNDKLKAAIDRANYIAFVASPDTLPMINDDESEVDPPTPARDAPHRQAITIRTKNEVFTQDAARAAPVFNYARLWEWSSAVETIARAFESADMRARSNVTVNPKRRWVHPGGTQIRTHRDNRTGTIGQVQAYCRLPTLGVEEPTQRLPSGMWKRIFVASFFALGLQWATTGGAALIVISTPTTGLGCRSGSYILYGIISTIVWLMLLLSSYFAHYAKVRHDRGDAPSIGFISTYSAEGIATFLRRLSTFAAFVNTIWVVLVGMFQFSDTYSSCYCNSSVLGRGAKDAYYIINLSGSAYGDTMAGWLVGLALAGGYVIVYLFALNVMLEPSKHVINS